MTTAWRVDSVSRGLRAGAGPGGPTGTASTGALGAATTTNSQYGDWTFGKARPAGHSRTGFKPITNINQQPDASKSNSNISELAGGKERVAQDIWGPIFSDSARQRGVGTVIDGNNNLGIGDMPPTTQDTKSSKLFQRVKPLDFSHTKFSPRQNVKSNMGDTLSFHSAQTEPVANAG